MFVFDFQDMVTISTGYYKRRASGTTDVITNVLHKLHKRRSSLQLLVFM